MLGSDLKARKARKEALRAFDYFSFSKKLKMEQVTDIARPKIKSQIVTSGIGLEREAKERMSIPAANSNTIPIRAPSNDFFIGSSYSD